jgi:type I restriction enzyme S subunit
MSRLIGWELVTIDDVASYIQRGKSPKYTEYSALPVVNQKCIRWWGIDESCLKFVDPSQWSAWALERFLRPGDILWNSTGTGTIGRATIFNGLKGFDRAVADSHVTIVRCGQAILPKFLHFYIMSPIVQNGIGDMHTGSTNQVELNLSKIISTIISLPPLSEQRRIVAKLDSLLARSRQAREELASVPRLVERYKQAVLAAAFRGELTKGWRKAAETVTPAEAWRQTRQLYAGEAALDRGRGRDERAAMLEKDRDLEQALSNRRLESHLPSSWTWAGIGEVFGVYVGATPSRKNPNYWEGTVPWISSGEVAFCRISQSKETITEEGLRNTSTRIHPAGTVLLGMIGEGKTRGQAAILDITACNNQNCAAIRASEAGYSPEYIYWYLYAEYERTRTAGAGNNQPALNKTSVQRLPIPLAPPEESFIVAQEIEKRLQCVLALEDHLERWMALLDRLEESTLAKAFRGELIPQDPNDEPASVLLERLKMDSSEVPKPRRGRRPKKPAVTA